jgi:hypothetical protein
MRNLADLGCPQCGREFYGDLPAGHGLYYPMLLQRDTGEVHDRQGVPWFAGWLRDSFAGRVSAAPELGEEVLRPLKRPLLLNCLDPIYGHALLKLLNAQYYLDQEPAIDLVVLVPKALRWLVPDGVAAVWTVDWSWRRGTEWNDALARLLQEKLGGFEECFLSVALSHPHEYQIERFTRVKPFDKEAWLAGLARGATVTFIWRDDRTWQAERLGAWSRLRSGAKRQRAVVSEFAHRLASRLGRLDFAVVGLGEPGGFDAPIRDLRCARPDPATERIWCERYAASHLVVGVHGSNMLLPSAHAGAVLEMVPPERWGNVVQDLLLPARDVREGLVCYRLLPLDVAVETALQVAHSLLCEQPAMRLNFATRWCDHRAIQAAPHVLAQRRESMVRAMSRIATDGSTAP